jgi:hypothetical protein
MRARNVSNALVTFTEIDALLRRYAAASRTIHTLTAGVKWNTNRSKNSKGW